MYSLQASQIHELVSLFFIPLSRILGFMTTAPLFGHRAIPIQYRLGLGIFLTILIIPFIPNNESVELASTDGFLIVIREMLIGIAIGMTMQMVFIGIELSGEMISMTMGLGFASFFDPQTQGRTYSLSQFFALLAVLLFLASDFHLHMIQILIESFTKIPSKSLYYNMVDQFELLKMAGSIFEIGIHLSIPIITIILITNLAFGILTKAAPQLNLFGVGFPATLLTGYVALLLLLIYWDTLLFEYFSNAFTRLELLYTKNQR